ncbi:hypothetical protein I3843_13G118500 [Carya illinoinensis]|uniref:FAF domain-containing protein n=1 Tax=Carya illinoinensis TaxID=32201 RepID=A0A8T1NQ28_CARIL|nr:hypothetical protein CIPAW_13G134900 [Carya illinoinensis]KAG6682310.1 hypothetical protein I3842_13G133700 [Carya illinoinensis]KAG7950533.1 hypothetical protein I3843_13G118500 [Carya illinoinensis]
MAACGSLQHIFENPLPENPTLLESLSSWNQIKPVKPIEQPSFTEIFGELHFKENSDSSPSCLPTPLLSLSSSSSLVGLTLGRTGAEKLNTSDGSAERDENKSLSRDSFSGSSSTKYSSHLKSSDSFSSMNSDSLQFCTEGLGFESSDDVEELSEMSEDNRQHPLEKISITKHQFASENQGSEFRRSKTSGGAFPPPISSISKSGKPWVCFKSFRQDGRFVLKEVRIPTHEFLHACREDGRLKLQFVQRKDEILEEEEEEEDDDDEEEEEEDEDEEDQEEADLEDKDEEDDISENDKDGKEDDNGVRNGEAGNKAEGNPT